MTETASTRGCAAMRARSAPFAPAFTASSVQASAGPTPGLPTPRGEGRANAPPAILLVVPGAGGSTGLPEQTAPRIH